MNCYSASLTKALASKKIADFALLDIFCYCYQKI